MNLLLLLSALLSALTGVAGATRAVEPQAVAERVIASPVAERVAAVTQRPPNVVAGRRGSGTVRIVLPSPPLPAVPLYLNRRRE